MYHFSSDRPSVTSKYETGEKMAQSLSVEKPQDKEPVPQSARIHEVNIDDYIADLTAAFQNGFTIEEACSYIGIDPSTYYRHLKKNQSFAEKMARAKRFTEFKAKERVTQILVKGSDKDAGPMARWLLEKKQPEVYGNKSQIQQNTQQNYFNLSYQQLESLLKEAKLDTLGPVELLELIERPLEGINERIQDREEY